MQLSWQRCVGNVWGSLLTVNLNHFHFNNMEGVYIIWQHNGPVVRVGQGVIKDRLWNHRDNPEIARHNPSYVTWARVPVAFRNGVERFLANFYSPLVGDAFPVATPISVNLPQ
jgi:hypothetical protein